MRFIFTQSCTTSKGKRNVCRGILDLKRELLSLLTGKLPENIRFVRTSLCGFVTKKKKHRLLVRPVNIVYEGVLKG